jgi:hypothetical protein
MDQSLNVATWITGDNFRKIAGSGSANAINKLRGRLKFVRDRLLGV